MESRTAHNIKLFLKRLEDKNMYNYIKLRERERVHTPQNDFGKVYATENKCT